jgi:hypothetical protein
VPVAGVIDQHETGDPARILRGEHADEKTHRTSDRRAPPAGPRPRRVRITAFSSAIMRATERGPRTISLQPSPRCGRRRTRA